MKKILSIVMMMLLSVAIYAQKNVTKFMGIPVDGTKAQMIQKLKAKGFRYNPQTGMLSGTFNGRKSYISVAANKGKVYRVMVADANYSDETNVKIRFNTLCQQFYNNSKYIGPEDQYIPEDEDISYNMLVKNQRYQAVFYQTNTNEEDYEKRTVWFMISEFAGEYGIYIYYDNQYNIANGEDL